MLAAYILIGLVAGVFAGFFGIGGAIIMVPCLVLILGYGQHHAQGTTLAAMVPPIGLLATLYYYKQGYVNIVPALLIALGFFFGGYFGAQFAGKIPDLLLRRIFGVFLLIIAFRLIVSK